MGHGVGRAVEWPVDELLNKDGMNGGRGIDFHCNSKFTNVTVAEGLRDVLQADNFTRIET